MTIERMLGLRASRVLPSSLTDLQGVLAALASERVTAVAFVGKFWKQSVFSAAGRGDVAGQRLGREGLSDDALARMAVVTLEAMGVEVLDQRRFLGPWLLSAEQLTSRAPTDAEWEEIRAGWRLARELANRGVGQTLVRARGVTVAVEASEGTDETIRRGVRLSGPGAVVIKAVADDHDFRFDVPAVGLATLDAMAAGGATALAVARGRTLLVDGEAVTRRAEEAGIAVVTLEDGA